MKVNFNLHTEESQKEFMLSNLTDNLETLKQKHNAFVAYTVKKFRSIYFAASSKLSIENENLIRDAVAFSKSLKKELKCFLEYKHEPSKGLSELLDFLKYHKELEYSEIAEQTSRSFVALQRENSEMNTMNKILRRKNNQLNIEKSNLEEKFKSMLMDTKGQRRYRIDNSSNIRKQRFSSLEKRRPLTTLDRTESISKAVKILEHKIQQLMDSIESHAHKNRTTEVTFADAKMFLSQTLEEIKSECKSCSKSLSSNKHKNKNNDKNKNNTNLVLKVVNSFAKAFEQQIETLSSQLNCKLNSCETTLGLLKQKTRQRVLKNNKNKNSLQRIDRNDMLNCLKEKHKERCQFYIDVIENLKVNLNNSESKCGVLKRQIDDRERDYMLCWKRFQSSFEMKIKDLHLQINDQFFRKQDKLVNILIKVNKVLWKNKKTQKVQSTNKLLVSDLDSSPVDSRISVIRKSINNLLSLNLNCSSMNEAVSDIVYDDTSYRAVAANDTEKMLMMSEDIENFQREIESIRSEKEAYEKFLRKYSSHTNKVIHDQEREIFSLKSAKEPLELLLSDKEYQLVMLKSEIKNAQETLGDYYHYNLVISICHMIDSLNECKQNHTDTESKPKKVQTKNTSSNSMSNSSSEKEKMSKNIAYKMKRMKFYISSLENKIQNDSKGISSHFKEVVIKFIKKLPALDQDCEELIKIILTMVDLTGPQIREIEKVRGGYVRTKTKLLGILGL